MTCIIGIESATGVLIAGDSAGVSGLDLTVRADSKVFANAEYVVGFTSSFRFGQLLRYSDLPDGRGVEVDQDAEERFMATAFTEGVRDVLRVGGALKVESGVEEGGAALVGWRGRLYMLAGDFQIARPLDTYMAVGSGANVALGALFAMAQNKNLSAELRAQTALRAAVRFNTCVASPFKMLESHRPGAVASQDAAA